MGGLMMAILVTASVLMGLCVVIGAWAVIPFLLIILVAALIIRVKIDRKKLAAEGRAFRNLSPEQQDIVRRRRAAEERWNKYNGKTR